jgi:hypothetical protein
MDMVADPSGCLQLTLRVKAQVCALMGYSVMSTMLLWRIDD